MRRLRVIVAGADVAGLEAMFALRALAGAHVDVTLIAANRYFEYRPVQVRDPLAVHARVRVPLTYLVGAGDLRYDRVVAVDAAARRAHTAAGLELPYDALLIADRAVPREVAAGAHPLDDAHASECGAVISELLTGRSASLAFIDPAAPTDPFDLYDLAIDTAVALRREGRAATLTLVTAAPAPLAILGGRAAAALQETLGAHGLHVLTSACVRSVATPELGLTAHTERVAADRVIAAPRLDGPRIDGLPCDRHGFLATDVYGRVPHADAIFAAGGCTSFPVKHPSIAAQQAGAAAASIAADAGAQVAPHPFTPVLRCILPSRLRWYVEAPLTGGLGDATRISAHPLWSRQLRFDAPYLAPHLDPATDALAS
ncbi:MAG TPA: FAD-dependent oxidoreductase [Solirubrobacteraceae bacterium]|nr:FAD-dependent oxidoreductase [Solirubrobacteraceae bacterium]